MACKWINGEFAQATKYKETRKRRVAAPNPDIDNFVKHVYREHKQEADHPTNISSTKKENI